MRLCLRPSSVGRSVKTGLYLLILAAALPAVGKPKKPTGQISDPAAFARVRSYCVDASGLPENEAHEVNSFVEEQRKPGRLLTKIPWKLYPDCREASPDAIIKLEFPRMNVLSIPLGQPQYPQEPDVNPYRVKAVLLVLDADSSKVLYKNQADPLDTPTPENQGSGSTPPAVQRRNAMYGAFWTLAQDVQRTEQTQKH
jgi:hypothetical protein